MLYLVLQYKNRVWKGSKGKKIKKKGHTMNFFPDELKTENTSRYTRFTPNSRTKLRMLGEPIFGYETWVDGQPKRFALDDDIPAEEVGDDGIKQFMAIKVYNYNEKCIQVLQLSQKTILRDLKSYAENSDYGDPTGYDIEIVRKGDGMNTRYQVIVSPPKPISAEVKKADEAIDVDPALLFINGDPFLNG